MLKSWDIDGKAICPTVRNI